MSSTVHVVDGIGICVKCNRCGDPLCCEQGPCDESAWDLDGDWEKVSRAMVHDRRRRA